MHCHRWQCSRCSFVNRAFEFFLPSLNRWGSRRSSTWMEKLNIDCMRRVRRMSSPIGMEKELQQLTHESDQS